MQPESIFEVSKHTSEVASQLLQGRCRCQLQNAAHDQQKYLNRESLLCLRWLAQLQKKRNEHAFFD
jgi:hypothetical protein